MSKEFPHSRIPSSNVAPRLFRRAQGIQHACLYLAIFTLALLPTTASLAHSQSKAPTEYQVKAAFLFNFAKFIDWPPKSFADAQSPFKFCILGHDPFGNSLDQYLAGKTVGDRAVAIDRIAEPGETIVARHCQIVFVSASEQVHFRKVIDLFDGQSTLLVGDVDGFATSGGTIEFLLEDQHIRFAINPDAAVRADLKVSSKLLALAQIVHDDSSVGKN